MRREAECLILRRGTIVYIAIKSQCTLFYFILLFFACPKKSNKRKGTTLTNHKLLLVAHACATLLQNLWFALSVDICPQATDASKG